MMAASAGVAASYVVMSDVFTALPKPSTDFPFDARELDSVPLRLDMPDA